MSFAEPSRMACGVPVIATFCCAARMSEPTITAIDTSQTAIVVTRRVMHETGKRSLIEGPFCQKSSANDLVKWPDHTSNESTTIFPLSHKKGNEGEHTL